MNIKFPLFSMFQKDTPRLTMISSLDRSKASDNKLRKILYDLSTPEYEESFESAGFPRDDGKRAYLPHEADDKLAFHCDRLWEKVGESKYRITSVTTPEKYFKYYDYYMSYLQALAHFETYARFRTPIPSEQIRITTRDEENLQYNMIGRAWDSALRRTEKLNKEESKQKAIDSFLQEFSPFMPRLKPKALKRIQKISNEIASKPVSELQAPEKAKSVFDAGKERTLIKEYRKAPDEMKRHFARLPLIQFYYKYRDEPKWLEKCEKLCLEDISSLPKLDEIERSRARRVYENAVRHGTVDPSRKKQYEEDIRRGFYGKIEAFDKLIMIYANRGEYEKAMEYCDMAAEHTKAHAYRGGEMAVMKPYKEKKERIIKKMQKAKMGEKKQ